MRSRPSFITTCMTIAEAIAQRSHDEETQVGAVLYDTFSKSIIAVSFNGHVRGAPSDLPSTRPEKYIHMVHAEQNLICNCAKLGISMEDCAVVCTKTPCAVCIRLLFQVGVRQIIAKEAYSDWESVHSMRDIKIRRETDPKTGFIYIDLAPFTEGSI